MPEYPYTNVPGKLRLFFNKIQDVGRPSKVTQQWLTSIGFTSSNDRTVVRVLKFVGFADSAGVPTGTWSAYRDRDKAPAVLANAIREAYSDLFQTYGNAFDRPDGELRNYFSTKTDAGAQAVSATVTTFKTLCSLAEFTTPVAHESEEHSVVVESPALSVPATRRSVERTAATGLTINLNIQIAVPETKDDQIYDNFFRALKRHLIADDG